jgi:hypothetical protein
MVLTISQLPSIIFLQAEFAGCMWRAYNDTDPDLPPFSILTVQDGTYCASEYSGTKAISFQITMMLILQFAAGAFAYYGEKEMTMDRISRLDITSVQAVQMMLILVTFVLALYLFGTRGKVSVRLRLVGVWVMPKSNFAKFSRSQSTLYYTKEQIDDDDVEAKYNVLRVIFFCWMLMWFADVGQRLRNFFSDKDFLEDLRLSREFELSNSSSFSQDISSGLSMGELSMIKSTATNEPVVANKRSSIWNLKSASSVSDTSGGEELTEEEQQVKLEMNNAAKTKKFKNAEKRGEMGPDNTFFDFSPGML